MAIQRELLYDIAAFLLDCACESLATTDAGCPERRCVVPGSEAEVVNCCQNQGQLTVALNRIFPSDNFPNPSLGQTGNCDSPYTVAVYNVDIFRCMPPGRMEVAPTCDQLDSTAFTNMQDMWAVRNGISCCFRDEDRSNDVIGHGYRWTLGDHTNLVPEGSCVGSRLEVGVGYLTCWECE